MHEDNHNEVNDSLNCTPLLKSLQAVDQIDAAIRNSLRSIDSGL